MADGKRSEGRYESTVLDALFGSCVLQQEAPRCSLYDNRIVTCIHCGRTVLVDRPVLEV